MAGGLIAGWLALHLATVFLWRWTPLTAVLALPVVALQSWLGAGMFIVAHDAMHGSLLPGWRRGNDLVGQLAVGLYAGFDYRRLAAAHHGHHRTPGAEGDPDFHSADPTAFWSWYGQFFLTYFGWAELLRLSAVFWLYVLALKAPALNMAVFWGAPALLSSLQLFTFGTWLPHRHGGEPFADHHHARTLGKAGWYTLVTCFHFGLHHEHHTHPHEPWWRLPAVRRAAVGA